METKWNLKTFKPNGMVHSGSQPWREQCEYTKLKHNNNKIRK